MEVLSPSVRSLLIFALVAGPLCGATKVPTIEAFRQAIVEGLRDRARDDDPVAQNNLGKLYSEGKWVPQDSIAAVKWFRKSAENGYVMALYNMGCMYAEGRGVPQDMAAAASWFRQAAEHGFVVAQYNVGSMYRFGDGVPKDGKEAVKWLQRAAERGDADSRNSLGYMYTNGDGVEKDPELGHLWWICAANGDSEKAKTILAELEKNLTPEEKMAARKRAKAMLAKYDTGPEVLPSPVSQTAPKYPYKLRFFNVEGEVTVDFFVDTHGNVQNAYALESSQIQFESPAVEAVKKWKFRPGQRGGIPAETHMQVPIQFKLTHY